MKVQKRTSISSFGGMNFVLKHLDQTGLNTFYNRSLPALSKQSHYQWSDIMNSVLSVYLCGGDCIEDLSTHLKPHFTNNPFMEMSSPDTVLRRLSGLAEDNKTCVPKRGMVEHTYNTNSSMEQLMVSLLKTLGVFDANEITLDYDNTIIFNEKSDSKMTYKRNPGYQPGVCTLNEEHVLYIENRNGNSDAKSFQKDTLERLFTVLEKNDIKKADHFRADAASYQYEIVRLLDKQVNNFYIGCRNSYIEKYFSKITGWEETYDSLGNKIEVGEINIIPFERQAQEEGVEAKPYRLVVKRKLKKDGQYDVFTQDAYEYRAILTNNDSYSAIEVALFYNQRGNMEKQFDILKNDFGWNKMPFSKLNQNTVFLYVTAICRNIYNHIIGFFSRKVKGLRSTFRVKKFLFRFILLPAKWVQRSRQLQLNIYGKIQVQV